MSKIQLSDSKYVIAYYDEDLNLFEQTWLEESEDMEDEEYKSLQLDMHSIADSIDNIRFDLLLLDNRNFLFSMSPELQEWQAVNISSKLTKYCPNPEAMKIAVIVSSDFISQLSIEQALEEEEGTEQGTKYFEDEGEARDWLMSGVKDVREKSTSSTESTSGQRSQDYAKTNISESKYFDSHFEPSLNAYEVFWNREGNTIDEDEYKELMQKELEAVLVYEKIDTIFFDMQEFSHVFFAEFNKWYLETIVAEIVKYNPEIKIAYLAKDQEDIDMIALQQLVDAVENLKDVVKYFDDEQIAREWLMGI